MITPQTPLRFRTQRPNEKVLLETRRHWWSWVRWLPLPIAFMLICWVLSAILNPLAPALIFVSVLFPSVFIFYMYLEWSNDSIYVTDSRIVRISRNLLKFSDQISEIPVTSIQEIQADIPNWDPFALLLRYGFIALKTSGNAGDVTLSMIPDPEGMQEIILEDFANIYNQTRQTSDDEIRANLQKWVVQGGAQQPFHQENQLQANNVPIAPPPFSPFTTQFPTANGGMIYRKHWYIWLSMVLLPIFLIIASIVTFFAISLAGSPTIGFAVGIAMGFAGILWFWWNDYDWRNDYMIVNDNTITIIHQRPLWLQNEKDVLLLRRVDNVIAESQGLFNQLLNKGTLRFALIGGDTYKEFTDVLDPVKMQGELAKRQAMARSQTGNEAQDSQQQMMGQYISMYHEMMGAPRPQNPNVPMTPQMPANPAQNQMQATQYRDAQRPPIVPQQRPNLTQGKPYVPPAQPFGQSYTPVPQAQNPIMRPNQPQAPQYGQPPQAQTPILRPGQTQRYTPPPQAQNPITRPNQPQAPQYSPPPPQAQTPIMNPNQIHPAQTPYPSNPALSGSQLPQPPNMPPPPNRPPNAPPPPPENLPARPARFRDDKR
jgi:hypothetical protein